MRNFKFIARLSFLITLTILTISIYQYIQIDKYYHKYGSSYDNINEKDEIIETLKNHPYEVKYEGLIIPGETQEEKKMYLDEEFENIIKSYIEMDNRLDEIFDEFLLGIIALSAILFLISLYFLIFSFQLNSNKNN